MSLYYLILWNQVDILQKHFRKDHVHMRLWTRFYGKGREKGACDLLMVPSRGTRFWWRKEVKVDFWWYFIVVQDGMKGCMWFIGGTLKRCAVQVDFWWYSVVV